MKWAEGTNRKTGTWVTKIVVPLAHSKKEFAVGIWCDWNPLTQIRRIEYLSWLTELNYQVLPKHKIKAAFSETDFTVQDTKNTIVFMDKFYPTVEGLKRLQRHGLRYVAKCQKNWFAHFYHKLEDKVTAPGRFAVLHFEPHNGEDGKDQYLLGVDVC